jgi:hypothetical protein
VPILSAFSDKGLQWHWHDFDWLMLFIERDRLARRDFSVLSAEAG